MATKREQIRRLSTDVERYAAACRGAAIQIRKIVDTLPANRYKGQQEMLLLVAESLDAQAVDVTIEGRMADPERLGLIGQLGQSRVTEAAAVLTAVGTLGLGAFGAADHFAAAEQSIEQVNNYSIQIVIEAEGSLRSGTAQMSDRRDTAVGSATSAPTPQGDPAESDNDPADVVDEILDRERSENGALRGGDDDPSVLADTLTTEAGDVLATDHGDRGPAESAPFETLSDAQQDGIWPPIAQSGQRSATVRPDPITVQTSISSPTVVTPRGTVSRTSSGTAHITTGEATVDGNGSFSDPQDEIGISDEVEAVLDSDAEKSRSVDDESLQGVGTTDTAIGTSPEVSPDPDDEDLS